MHQLWNLAECALIYTFYALLLMFCLSLYVHYKVQLEPQKKARILGVIMLLYAIVVTAVYLISMSKDSIKFIQEISRQNHLLLLYANPRGMPQMG